MKKLSYNKGYAILFTIVVIGVISLIAFGISNTTYKQVLLSSVAKNSSVAFYQADTATECALYADAVVNMFAVPNPVPDSWQCGIEVSSGKEYQLKVEERKQGEEYALNPVNPGTDQCFDISVYKTWSGNASDPVLTKIKGRGYNICNKDDTRTVQREIEVNY